jgi:hypothetical protein
LAHCNKRPTITKASCRELFGYWRKRCRSILMSPRSAQRAFSGPKTMFRQLQRRLDDDYAFNVNIKFNLFHNSLHLHGFIRKSVVRAWLSHFVNTPLYRIKNPSRFDPSPRAKRNNLILHCQMLCAYSEATILMFPSMNPNTKTPILLCCDFNTDVTQNNFL